MKFDAKDKRALRHAKNECQASVLFLEGLKTEHKDDQDYIYCLDKTIRLIKLTKNIVCSTYDYLFVPDIDSE